ncbi:MAG: LiaI-LiaF-like domain-containing protein [bacterium]
MGLEKMIEWNYFRMLGLFLIILGVLLLLRNLGVITANFWAMLWPLVIVFFGISMLFTRKGRHRD